MKLNFLPRVSAVTSTRQPWFWLLLLLLALGSGLHGAAAPRMLFDDYYQRSRPEEQFGQGVARGGSELRNLSNFYSPDANAIPNGTFVFSQLVADRFQVEISRKPLSAELLQGVASYLLVCPVRADHGGRASLTEHDADVLEAFVAQGGSLALVANSIPEPEKSDMDLAGLNLIARRFGVRFLATQTDTISIPISAEHPVFAGAADNIIFGNGTTLEVLPTAESGTQVLLESHSPRAPGPAAVLATYKKGRVLLFGDAGTFGNAHLFRSDIGQLSALQQMMDGLLPDGPVPRYSWKEGAKLRVTLRQEQIISGYPEFLRVFSLPRPAGSTTVSSAMRTIDLQAAGGKEIAQGFVSAISQREAKFLLTVGAADGPAREVTWTDANGKLTARLLSSGRLLAPGVPAGDDVSAWQGVLLNEAIGAPLKASALPGERWETKGLASLPQLRLTMTPKWVQAPSTCVFEGEASYEGTPCYVFKRIVQLDGQDWSPEDLVGPEYAMQFSARDIHLLNAGQLAVAHYWISKDTLLPRHTEVKVSAALWWRDPRFPSQYIGTHDSKNHENWTTINLNLTYGRALSIDFAPL